MLPLYFKQITEFTGHVENMNVTSGSQCLSMMNRYLAVQVVAVKPCFHVKIHPYIQL